MDARTDLNDLRCVAAICEEKSLSGAARRLNVNHATVFRRLNQLEVQLGVRLFERGGGRYVPTAAGEELARAGAAIEKTAEQSLLKVAGRDLRPSGLVRLTTTDSIAQELLNPIVALCRSRYPQITLQLSIDHQMYNLAKRDADIAIRPVLQVPDYLIGKRIGPLALAVYGAPSYLDDMPDKAWAGHAWIALDDANEQHPSLLWLAKIKPLDQVGYRINSFHAIRKACLDGLGLALIPCFMGDGDPGLRRVLPPVPELSLQLWLLTHPDLRDTVRTKAIFQILQQELKRLAPRLAGTA
jgi:DNA-binding transcriptional LysR family regulator